MTLDEFRTIYETNGEIVAKLVIHDVDCDLRDFVNAIPELARYFPTTGAAWCLLLCSSPLWASHCDWSIFDSICLTYLVVCRPAFAPYCDWDIIDGVGWASILSHHPSFHIHCDARKLNTSQWLELLIKQPKLQSKFDAIIHDII